MAPKLPNHLLAAHQRDGVDTKRVLSQLPTTSSRPRPGGDPIQLWKNLVKKQREKKERLQRLIREEKERKDADIECWGQGFALHREAEEAKRERRAQEQEGKRPVAYLQRMMSGSQKEREEKEKEREKEEEKRREAQRQAAARFAEENARRRADQEADRERAKQELTARKRKRKRHKKSKHKHKKKKRKHDKPKATTVGGNSSESESDGEEGKTRRRRHHRSQGQVLNQTFTKRRPTKIKRREPFEAFETAIVYGHVVQVFNCVDGQQGRRTCTTDEFRTHCIQRTHDKVWDDWLSKRRSKETLEEWLDMPKRRQALLRTVAGYLQSDKKTAPNDLQAVQPVTTT